MSHRPDLVECWVFRVHPRDPGGLSSARDGEDNLEVLLLRRAPDRIFPGLWQCVTGRVEPGERIPLGALRELHEETGFADDDIEALYDLDQAVSFYDQDADGILVSSIFAVRVRADAVARTSHEHDVARWVSASDAAALVVWPSYGESIRRIASHLLDPAIARWFEMDRDGRRISRRAAG